MSYLVLARKYRPALFSSVAGQEHVTRTLMNAIKRNKVPHALLFSGPRGVGKTSIARIFSKALNCAEGPTTEPCLKCSNCEEITRGTSLAVREIDGASHNSVDNVRELIESFRTLPAPGYRYKIYIIDEVHMLSVAAFNALLKSLEEPPPNTVFILATTEAHRIPDTVISRCQRNEFKALSVAEIKAQLKQVAQAEKLAIEEEALRMIARLADGSMRDAQSLLERVQSFAEGKVTAADTAQVLGVVERRLLFSLAAAIFGRRSDEALALVAQAFSVGLDVSIFLKELVTYWRELLLAKFSGKAALAELGIPDDDVTELISLVADITAADLKDLFDMVRRGSDSALRSAYPRFALEALVVRMATREPVHMVRTILDELRSSIVQGKTALAAAAGPAKTMQGAVGARASGPAPQPEEARSAARSGPLREPRASALASASDSAGRAPRAIGSAAVKELSFEQSEAAPALNPASERELIWGDFLIYVGRQSARILLEHLRRLAVSEFRTGRLVGDGPEFTLATLERPGDRQKLLELLQGFSGVGTWALTLSKGPGAQNTSAAQTPEAVSEHPHIKELQRFFPGSKIEIKIKE